MDITFSVGDKFKWIFGSALPKSQQIEYVIEIRAIVDDMWIVLRSRRFVKNDYKWDYRLEHITWLTAHMAANNLQPL